MNSKKTDASTHLFPADVAELVDALDSKSSDFGRAGSIPASSTTKNHNTL